MRAVAVRAWLWVRLAVAVGVLAVLAWRLGVGAFADGVRVLTGVSVLAALGIGLLTTLCCAARWRLIARRLELRLPLSAAVTDYYRSLLLNAVLPAGVLGDVHRGLRHGRLTGDVGKGMRAVVLERFAGQVILVVGAFAVLVVLPLPTPRFEVPVAAAFAAAVLVVLAGLAVAAPRWRGRLTVRCRSMVGAVLTDTRRGLLARGAWPAVTALSVLALSGHVTLFVVAAKLAGSSASVAQLVPLVVLALFAMALPLNVGGWGPREAATTVAFAAAGLPAQQGLTTAVAYGVLALVACLPGVLVLGIGIRGVRRG